MDNTLVAFFKKDQRWIPSMFFGMFGIIFIVNGIMVYVAFNSWTGFTEDHYRKGLAYNKVLDATAAQEALGWQKTLDLTSGDGVLTASLLVKDKQGAPLAVDKVAVEFIRPTNVGYDFADKLQAQGEGQFSGEWKMPLAGNWDLRIYIYSGEDRYVLSQRAFVKPDS
ncbi:FixH family protein [Rhodovibrionaceae bacterium A322]